MIEGSKASLRAISGPKTGRNPRHPYPPPPPFSAYLTETKQVTQKILYLRVENKGLASREQVVFGLGSAVLGLLSPIPVGLKRVSFFYRSSRAKVRLAELMQ
jgi:hypothetical protein